MSMFVLHNTMTRKREVFKSLHDGIVTMYNCGLTVYDYATIGNLRSFIFADILRRYLEYKGYTVRQVMNFTDVGHMFGDVDIGQDRMAAAAEREKKDPLTLAEHYIKAFLEDATLMNIEEPMKRPRATEHIQDMIELVQKILDNGYAYVVNGSVYFDVTKFKDYGKLSGNTIDRLRMGAGGRVGVNPEKKNQFDFALWINDPTHIMHWKSPWNEKGYPGWHVECSAMSMKYLGEVIDIHTGGVDNIFPHHENEIAQSEAATGKKFVNYWLHGEHLLVEGQRMGKSLGNYYTLKDLTNKGYSPKAVRYLLFSAHYRQQLNFTFEGLEAAEGAVDRLINFISRLREVDGEDSGGIAGSLALKAQKEFEEAMDDDLNTVLALAALFELVRETNNLIDKQALSRLEGEQIEHLMMRFDNVLGVIEVEPETKMSKDVEELIHRRDDARKAKDWKLADQLRHQLREKGVIVEDTAAGVKWRIEKKANSAAPD